MKHETFFTIVYNTYTRAKREICEKRESAKFGYKEEKVVIISVYGFFRFILPIYKNSFTPYPMKKEPMNAADKALKHEINFLHNQISIISNIDVVKSNHKNVGYTTMLCTDGTCSVLLNQRELHIKKNDLLFFGPNDKIEDVDKSEDLSMRGFYLTEEFFKELSNIPIGLINAHVYIAEHPLLNICDRAAEVFIQYHDLIRSKLNVDTPMKHHKLITDLLMEAFIYEFHDMLEDTIEVRPVYFTSGDNLFKEFLNLVMSTYPKPRSVAWYAEQMNVTPKYLSSVTKTQGGETASTIITRYVVEDIKRNLMRPEKSIKQIVCELDFPSISFFGKYVKKNLGMSPKYYREQIIKNLTEDLNIKKWP